MSKKRDIIAEILERRSRTLRRVDRYDQFNRRHDEILNAVELLTKYAGHEPVTRAELLKYIPIGIVACWEGYFRMLIRDLIDQGDPFRGNALALDVGKLDIALLFAMNAKKVTPGELIAHQLSINSLEDINKHLSVVIGDDFLQALKGTTNPDTGDALAGIEHLLFADIKEIFETRHILSHELAVRTQPSIPGARNAVSVSLVFTYHTEILAQQLLGGPAPEL